MTSLLEGNECQFNSNGYYQCKCKLTTEYQNTKKLNASKGKKRPFTSTIRRDLIFLQLSVIFYESHVTLLCVFLNPGLTFLLSS